MKKALLIPMMFLLPWLAASAAQRSVVHMLSCNGDAASISKHIAEHEANVPHHHHIDAHDSDDEDKDDDDSAVTAAGTHEDHSSKSLQHLSDYDHGGSLHLLLQASAPLFMSALADVPPAFTSTIYPDRTTLPPLRPPCMPA